MLYSVLHYYGKKFSSYDNEKKEEKKKRIIRKYFWKKNDREREYEREWLYKQQN
jgi:hypothetical protein